MAAEYDTHDNGGRAFRVTVPEGAERAADPEGKHADGDGEAGAPAGPFTVRVARLGWNGELRQVEPLSGDGNTFVFAASRVFVGRSPDIAMTRFSGGLGDAFDGNSLLIQLADPDKDKDVEGGGGGGGGGGGLEYVHVGIEVFRFVAEGEVVAYASPVGNSDVPYPWAVDGEGRHYLMIEDKVVADVPEGTENAYTYAYGIPALGRGLQEGEEPYGGVAECKAGDDTVYFGCDAHPARTYARVVERQGPISVRKGDEWHVLDENEFVQLISGYSALHKVSGFQGKQVIAARA